MNLPCLLPNFGVFVVHLTCMVWGGLGISFSSVLNDTKFFVKLEFYNLLFCHQLWYGGCTVGKCGMGVLGCIFFFFFCAVPLSLLPLMPYHHFIIIVRIHSPCVMFQPLLSSCTSSSLPLHSSQGVHGAMCTLLF